jgi:hypothetical protein
MVPFFHKTSKGKLLTIRKLFCFYPDEDKKRRKIVFFIQQKTIFNTYNVKEIC